MPPRPESRDIMRRGAPGVRLPRSEARLDEDDYCVNRCGGTMLVTPDGDCTCFQHAPCPSCERAYLKCSGCGFEYRNTAEDNMVVDMVRATWPERTKKVVDMPPFSLYDIYQAPKGAKRIREVKEID